MLGQELARPPDQHPRVVARGADDVDVGEELVASQPPRRAGLVFELGVQQLGHDVVGRVVDAPVDVVGEDGAAERVIADLGVPAACEEVIADGLLVALGHSEEHADDAHRHLRAEVGDEVEPTRGHERIQKPRTQVPDVGLERADPLGREHPREQ